jgi:hypothetical protein
MRSDPLFVFRALSYLDSGRMPKGAILGRSEREEIESYLLSVASSR